MKPLFLLLLTTLVLTPLRAQATSFLEVPFEQTVEEAPILVRGTTQESYADWGLGRDSVRRIYTYTPMEVHEWFKGQPSGSERIILLRELGGEKDGVGMRVSGTAVFSRAEDVVIMLAAPQLDQGKRVYDVRGMMMGKYNVKRDEQGEEYLVGAGLDGAEHPHERGLREAAEGAEGQGDTPSKSKWTLSRLRKLLKDQPDTTPEPENKTVTPQNHEEKPRDETTPENHENVAPGLQNTPVEAAPEAEGSAGLMRSKSPWLVLGLVLAIGGFWLRRRR